jgi:hypothetical protein
MKALENAPSFAHRIAAKICLTLKDCQGELHSLLRKTEQLSGVDDFSRRSWSIRAHFSQSMFLFLQRAEFIEAIALTKRAGSKPSPHIFVMIPP